MTSNRICTWVEISSFPFFLEFSDPEEWQKALCSLCLSHFDSEEIQGKIQVEHDQKGF